MAAHETRLYWPLPGGIHPAENKLQSLCEAIRQAPLPEQLVIPLSQPGFAQAELCVQEGEHVLKGQLLARGTAAMGVAAHASTSGTIRAITEHLVPNASALPELCAILEADGEDRWHRLPTMPDYQALDAHVLIDRISEAGISGLGGAGFPSHAKLRGALGKVETLVINACECEPFITADDALMREQAASIVTGIKIVLHICEAPRCLIGIEDNKPLAIAAMRAAMDDARITLVVVPTKYPSGAEKQLIYMLTGLEIPSGALPISSGILCHNVGTAYAITRAVLHGEALVSRITTFTGAALRRPGNLEVLIGTPVSDLLHLCELDETAVYTLINGGPLMGVQLRDADLPVLKISNCIIAATPDELPAPDPQQACIRCGFCAEVCPAVLLPQQLYWFARSRELEKATRHNLFDCIECGACAWVCPSHIPLVQYYRAAKADIRDEREKHRIAEHSKERYEFHQARKAVEKLLEEQRRTERAALARQKQEKGSGNTDAQATIAAALARVQAKKAAGQREVQRLADSGNSPAIGEHNVLPEPAARTVPANSSANETSAVPAAPESQKPSEKPEA